MSARWSNKALQRATEAFERNKRLVESGETFRAQRPSDYRLRGSAARSETPGYGKAKIRDWRGRATRRAARRRGSK